MAEQVTRIWPGVVGGVTRAERQPCKFSAYLPDPLLGRPLSLTAQRVADIADAERAVVELNAAQPALVHIETLSMLLLRVEAVASSFIEGLHINVRRLASQAIAEQAGIETRDRTATAVLANIRAVEFAMALGEKQEPIRVDDLLDLHRRLMAGSGDWVGAIRTSQNWVGGSGFSPCVAEFVPPPPEAVPALLDDLCAYISSDEHPALLQAIMVHAQFETIHPFADGNGRVGRALLQLILRRRGLAPTVVPPVSLILATHAHAYVSALTSYRYLGEPSAAQNQEQIGRCVDQFVADYLRACTDVRVFGQQLQELNTAWRTGLGNVRKGSAVDALVDALPSMPVLTTTTAARAINRSEQRTNDAIARLAAAGIVAQATIGRRNRAYEVPDVIAVITQFERALASPAGDTRLAKPVRPVPYPS